MGGAFSPRHGEWSDPGVALDEIMSLRAAQEPLVLRVAADGGTAAGRASVAGDWLCDSDGGEPERVPPARWTYPWEARRWARKRTWLDAWEACRDPSWMLYNACAAGLDTRLSVAGAVALMDAAIWPWAVAAYPAHEALRRATSAWCAGGDISSVARALDASLAAYEAGHRGRAEELVFRTARDAAWVAMGEASPARSYTHFIASRWMGQVGPESAVARLADAVRSSVQTVDVLRAACRNTAADVFARETAGRSRR